MVETREFFDAFPANQHKDDQGTAPPRATDPGWAHGIMVNGGRQKIKCKYCHKVILGGGISRLKQHLAGERGNVAPCEEVPEDVKVQIQQHLGREGLMMYRGALKQPQQGALAGKEGEKRLMKELPTRKRGTRNNFFPTATPVAQVSIHNSFASQESMDQADMAVARFMYEAGVPFSAANSYYFQQMADAIAAVGPGYKMPSCHSLRGKLLNRSVQDVEGLCEELRRSWEGTVFLRSVYASDIANSTEALLSLFVSVVEEVGPKNIVNFVTDTTPTYKAAGKLLMGRYKTFFWSACGAHCIDLMLEEVGKRDEVKELLAKAKRITQFIYNNTWVLNLTRKRTGGRDIVQLAITRFASNFLTLQSIVSFKEALHQMFTSATWMQSAFSKQRAGVEVAEIIVDPTFWSMCDRALKVMITSHINYYEEAVGDFSRPVALRGRESLAPATWWSLYAADYPDLQRLAVRILSQTCSVTRCETSWSMSERVHSKQRNRFGASAVERPHFCSL
ncbi:hypothetical protein CK203_077896 [Vitis vinifera]|uniref:BED-type domain-containing protein n=1 Tax=Vitis vinifera TaxID=29760 RepID=A0A438EB56_VITVI|nr:hypothetical protein CK203_077896 [Vitis vinifera]